MTAISVLERAVDGGVDDDVRLAGWTVCFGHPGAPGGPHPRHGLVKLLHGRERLRLVIGEPLGDDPPSTLSARVAGLARTLLFARLDPDATVDRLAGLTMWPDLDRGSTPRLSITVVDLHPDGSVDVGCRYAPSVLHASREGMLSLLPPSPPSMDTRPHVSAGDHLIAYSASFLGALPPETLSELPSLAAAHAGPCGLWHKLAAARRTPGGPRGVATPAVAADSANQAAEPPTDLVIVTRSLDQAGGRRSAT